MSMVSREMGRWLQSNPGPIYGRTMDELFSQARMIFCVSRRVKNPDQFCPPHIFQQVLEMRGYRPETREDHSKKHGEEGRSYFLLNLPGRHTGF